MGDGPVYPLKRSLLTSEASVQTIFDTDSKTQHQGHRIKASPNEDHILSLSASELASILEWSSEISKHIHLVEGEYALSLVGRHADPFRLALQRFTEIASSMSSAFDQTYHTYVDY